ncbi:restriction endonuclease subunit S [Defluviitalea raffinosedens]|uniref:Type I restriction modification DNA specificity domain-containing protein n=1 Tax=Defluviitalea raffinosedens TaxID=1450156 RepID=A0A7C8LPS2_9FIRM|nr:restriction endonuclease subunit S [Defluviitalea raffinosedens]KAE9633796.1 hypothetical protein GND95_09085 [Defluviitalea raffinosedens]MBM7686142.1 type I restriction enzyme S subunit [Defluviitalea raffinosedens]
MSKIQDYFVLIRNGANIRQNKEKIGYPITRIETISDGYVDREKMGYAGIKDLSKYEDYILKTGDILMSHINSVNHLGKVALYEKEKDEKIIHGMNLLVLRPNTKLIISKYAYYYFKSPYFKKQLPNITKNSVNQASFTVTDLKKLYIYVPSIEKQNTIVEMLDKVQSLIDKRKQQIEFCNELIKSQFVEIFGDPKVNPKHYKMKKLGTTFEIVSGGTPKTQVEDYWNPNDISWIGSNMCQDKIIYNNDGKFISYLGLENSSAKIIKPNAVLVALVGATIGKTALLKFETAINQNIAAIKVYDSNEYIPEFVFWYMQFIYYQFTAISKNKFKMASLNFLKELEIYQVPITLQSQFAAFVQQVENLRSSLQQSLTELENNFNSLMQKAFNGEVIA